MSEVYKATKKYCEREIRKTLVNVTMSNVSQPKRTSKENPHQRPSTLKLPPLIS